MPLSLLSLLKSMLCSSCGLVELVLVGLQRSLLLCLFQEYRIAVGLFNRHCPLMHLVCTALFTLWSSHSSSPQRDSSSINRSISFPINPFLTPWAGSDASCSWFLIYTIYRHFVMCCSCFIYMTISPLGQIFYLFISIALCLVMPGITK